MGGVRTLLSALLASALLCSGTAAQAPLDLQAQLPFDASVRTGTLPSGLTFYIRQNARPEKRVFLRLAVNAGSLDEEDDQQGLAHFLEHMAFNGSEHFPPGELISYFESFGSRLGPHLNAYTSFEETVYMLTLPTDRPEVVQKGLTAFADFAGGLTLDPAQIDKERGVVIEEWRGSLGAASRIRDLQIPVLYHDSRYAERLPIGKPEVLRTAPPDRFRAFYDTWYRPDRMAVVAVGDIDPAEMETSIRTAFAALKPRGESPAARNTSVPPHDATLVSVVADPEATRTSVSIVQKRPHPAERTVGDYRRALVQRILERALNERFDDLRRRPDAKILGAGAGGGRMAPGVESFALSAGVEDGRLEDGVTTLVIEANRAERHGFGPAELDQARRWMLAYYERAYRERDKAESPSLAQEYVSHFLEGEPSPGIEYEYTLAKALVPGITTAEVSALARELLHDGSRVVLAVSPQKDGIRIPTADELRAALAAAEKVGVTPWADTATTRELMERRPDPAAVESTRELRDIGVTIVRFANGLEAWLKPTDFKNDEIVFTMQARGGSSLAPPEDYLDASLSSSLVMLSGAGGLKALELQRVLAGKLVSAVPFVSLSTHGIFGSSTPAELETALQLLHQYVVAPGDDPDAFPLLKRQLDAAVVNRLQDPAQIFGDRVAAVNTSGHYTAQPLTSERVAALDAVAMRASYRERFANAADFTLFMVGAFTLDQAVPLLARYAGTLPSTGTAASNYRDVSIRFPSGIEQATVAAGREPRGQVVMSFFAEPSLELAEQESVAAAATVLETVLRDILREELGQTYGVSVGLRQQWPQRGGGHMTVRFGADPANVASMAERVLAEVKRLRQEGPTTELTERARESARRSYETALRQNGYWLGQLQSAHLLGRDPGDILRRKQFIEALAPATVREMFVKYFPPDRYTVVTLVPAVKEEQKTGERGDPSLPAAPLRGRLDERTEAAHVEARLDGLRVVR
jgi:zinc protease